MHKYIDTHSMCDIIFIDMNLPAEHVYVTNQMNL